jgi:hypothetical protein
LLRAAKKVFNVNLNLVYSRKYFSYSSTISWNSSESVKVRLKIDWPWRMRHQLWESPIWIIARNWRKLLSCLLEGEIIFSVKLNGKFEYF